MIQNVAHLRIERIEKLFPSVLCVYKRKVEQKRNKILMLNVDLDMSGYIKNGCFCHNAKSGNDKEKDMKWQ